jgi:hypothetical protein
LFARLSYRTERLLLSTVFISTLSLLPHPSKTSLDRRRHGQLFSLYLPARIGHLHRSLVLLSFHISRLPSFDTLLNFVDEVPHVWTMAERLVGNEALICCLFVPVMGAMMSVFCWMPSRDSFTWYGDVWTSGVYAFVSYCVLALVRDVVTAVVLWPFHLAGILFGAAYFLLSHGIFVVGITFPLLCLYCNFSTRYWSISSHLPLSFDSFAAKLLDQAVLPGLLHATVAETPLVNVPYLIVGVCALWINAAALVIFDSSIPLLILRGLAALESIFLDKSVTRAAVAASDKELEDVGSSTATETVARLEKEIQELKQRLSVAPQ